MWPWGQNKLWDLHSIPGKVLFVSEVKLQISMPVHSVGNYWGRRALIPQRKTLLSTPTPSIMLLFQKGQVLQWIVICYSSLLPSVHFHVAGLMSLLL